MTKDDLAVSFTCRGLPPWMIKILPVAKPGLIYLPVTLKSNLELKYLKVRLVFTRDSSL